MRVPFWSTPREFAIEPLEIEDASALPRIHEEDFIRPWSEDEFADLLAQGNVFGFAAREVGKRQLGPVGFVLVRQAADEAEILTVAVARSARRLGLGRSLMDAVLRALHAARTASLFLEVDETNAPAIALYRRLGFIQVGRRPDYYKQPGGGRTGAIVMRRDLH
ncbi:GNAT family N-acetyltransferase [Aliihoeflea sp. 40Bstr573]|uniref:GNAT family N-acetyltransferase n=1 Tax=Aliihoeflea sp. 40Bstr573 TaxID=2696467 RepID=UPI00209421A2|nr:GNAT family N-acetyltransferase [Aliihoeflea sp. 40Bstr573]MCO6389137.1 GNAT family N-acetyltransferase [Aliihoeflea sp. 40Bstr573]